MLVSEVGSLAVLSSSGFGSTRAMRPDGGLLQTTLATFCYYLAPPRGCEGDPARGELEAVVVRPGQKAQAAGWTIENHVAYHLPGNGGLGGCTVESMHNVLVTAHTPHPEAAPF